MAISTVAAGGRVRASKFNELITKINSLGTPPQFLVRRAATQSIGTGGSATPIQFDTEDADTDTMFSATSDTITIKTAGLWLFVGGGRLPGASGLKTWEITKGGTVQNEGAVTGPDTASQEGRTNVVRMFRCSVSDVIKLQAFQNSGGSVNATAYFHGIRISD